ncbi:hypothetical protein GGI07_000623 [Coemansia sp. Benny D115]|nr:hypothetical protein GGI07_000623 [Coemansia sp. Benny D115]
MMLCIYLATKVTEEPRKQRDIINVGYRLANRDSEILPVTDKVFLGLRASMAEGELAMMRILGFDLSVELPHVWAADILNGMAWWASDNGRPPDDTELVDPRMKRVAAEAWLMANAAVEHGLVDREPARILGAACVAIAIDRCGEALPARSLDEWADIWARTSARRLQAVKELLLSQVEAEKMRG